MTPAKQTPDQANFWIQLLALSHVCIQNRAEVEIQPHLADYDPLTFR